MSRVDLADSSMHAPQAGFGDTDFYPDLHDKAEVLACRIAWNYALPDGNKRVAWACLRLFIDLNRGVWSEDHPRVDDALEAMLSVAATNVDEAWFASWLRERVQFSEWHPWSGLDELALGNRVIHKDDNPLCGKSIPRSTRV